jgi:hypothetical protein
MSWWCHENLLFACLALSSSAQAQEIACPKFYPWEDTVIAAVPYQHNGQGVVEKQELSGASAMGSSYNVKPPIEFRGGPETKVKGGTDIVMPTDTKWFVCWYGLGRSAAWWEELKHDPGKVKACVMKIREKAGRDPMDIKFVCR